MTPTVTKVVAAVETTPTQDVATEAPTAVVEVTAAEALPAAIEAAEATVAVTPTEAEMVPTETPTLKAEATPEDAAQGQANTDPGPSEEQLQLLASLNNYGPAPQWHNDVWLNSEPLTLADLRGKVVMVEFWTFG
jgi:hypothetical protein